MRKYTVYKHTSPSGKVYIGITCRKPKYRWNNGKGYKEKDQRLFYNAIKKYGWENISHDILFEGISEDLAKELEKSYIRYYKTLHMSYNITDGGDGTLGAGYTHTGWKHTKETKEKMSQARKGLLAGSKNPMYGKHETNPAFGKFGVNHPASKKVYQYTLEGDFIAEYDCMTDAVKTLEKTQKEVTHITACCNGRHLSALGYIWRKYKVDKLDMSNFYIVITNKGKQLRQINKTSKTTK